MISIVLPAYNEEQVLEKNVKKLIDFLDKNLIGKEYKIIIADNASADRTSEIGRNLNLEFSNIIYHRLEKKGKGLAILSLWQKYPADINIFMDIDLSTDLFALQNLIDNNSDIVIGSRRHRYSVVERSFYRKMISSCLNLLLRVVFKTKIKDTACGFKAVNRKIINEILPKIKNQTWFFDTELLLLAERAGYKIKEIPIIWKEKKENGRKSSVGIYAIFDYIREIYDLKKRLN